MTSTGKDLRSRIQSRMETDSQVTATAKRAQQQLVDDLRKNASDGLNTIARATAEGTTRVLEEHRKFEAKALSAIERSQVLVLRMWFWLVVLGLLISVGIFGGSWGWMQWQSAEILNRIERLARLQVSIEEAERTLERLEEETWGVVLHEAENVRFVVLPAGTLSDPPWTVGGRPAVRLSNE